MVSKSWKQALVMRKFFKLSGISQKMDCKALRPKEIKMSEKHVSKLSDVLEHDYLNPFSVYLECEDVYNLRSGKSIGVRRNRIYAIIQ